MHLFFTSYLSPFFTVNLNKQKKSQIDLINKPLYSSCYKIDISLPWKKYENSVIWHQNY